MVTIEYSLRRVNSVIEEIERLKQSEFPYKSSKTALQILERKFNDHQETLKRLNRASPPPSQLVANNACSISLTDIYLYLPILGFILRSTSVRNAFETYGPLLRLAKKILKPSTKLILSSEWENTPFIYSEISVLPDFVLIGLPAQESENPLLLPLAGHELGHSVWRANDIASIYMTDVEDKIINEIISNYWAEYHGIYPQFAQGSLRDLFARSSWMPAYEFAMRQLEEIFCDLLGLRIFAESYLHAICYLLSPRVSGHRSLLYPNTIRRITHLEDGAREFSVNIPNEFSDSFEDNDEPSDLTIKFLVKLADITSASFVSSLTETVKRISNQKKIPECSHEKVEDLTKYFKNLVPTSEVETLADILNTAWSCFHNEELWKNIPEIKSIDKVHLLNELVLKSIEVYEIEQRIR